MFSRDCCPGGATSLGHHFLHERSIPSCLGHKMKYHKILPNKRSPHHNSSHVKPIPIPPWTVHPNSCLVLWVLIPIVDDSQEPKMSPGAPWLSISSWAPQWTPWIVKRFHRFSQGVHKKWENNNQIFKMAMKFSQRQKKTSSWKKNYHSFLSRKSNHWDSKHNVRWYDTVLPHGCSTDMSSAGLNKWDLRDQAWMTLRNPQNNSNLYEHNKLS